MNDIGTPEKLEGLVEEATKIPFESACGRIHYEVISLLQHYKKASPSYDAFLLRTLQGMDTPDEDDRARAIARRLLAPGQLGDPAWRALARLAARSRHSAYLMDALLTDTLATDASRKLLQARVSLLLDQADAGNFGRPVPRSGPELFTEILGSLQHDLVVLMGGMGTRNPEAIQALVRHLDDLDGYVADAAVEALARLGEPAVPALEAAFDRLAEPYKQMRVVQVFRLRGHGARAHLPWLKARLAEARSPHVRGALEDAVDALQ